MSKLVSYSKLFTLYSPNIIIDGHEIKVYKNRRNRFMDVYDMRRAFECPILMTFDRNDELFLVNNNNELYAIKMAIFPGYRMYWYTYTDMEDAVFNYSFDSLVEFIASFAEFLNKVVGDFRVINLVA